MALQCLGPCGSCIDLHVQRCCLCLADQCGSCPRLMAMCSLLWDAQAQLQASCLPWVKNLGLCETVKCRINTLIISWSHLLFISFKHQFLFFSINSWRKLHGECKCKWFFWHVYSELLNITSQSSRTPWTLLLSLVKFSKCKKSF